MPQVNIKNKGLIINVEKGTTLVNAIRSAMQFETPCGEKGLCGKCKVKAKGELSNILNEEIPFIKEGERLSCIAKVLGDVEVEIIESSFNMKRQTSGVTRKVDINNKYKNKGKYGISIDIGTTGLSVYLVSLDTGEVLSKESSVNPQVEYGGDVLSRISYSTSCENGIENLKNSIVNGINTLIDKMVKSIKISCDNILKVTIAANNVMLHMILGVDATPLSQSPYKPVFTDVKVLSKSDIDLNINENAEIIILPSVSAYVGADIVSGAVVCGFYEKKGNIVFIDIGTNGEIVISLEGYLYATATAAGPAFEGMNISCGSRAIKGAIDSFYIKDNKVEFTTIENSEAKSICGSGIMDIVGEFVKSNIIQKTGRINKKVESLDILKIIDKKVEITNNIYITQEDIRNIQLAKGAIYTGFKMLLNKSGEKIENIDEFIIAGSFGYHLREDTLKSIGIIPKEFKGKVSFVGNVSLEGARLALINDNILDEMVNVKNKINSIELSMEKEFEKEFVSSLRF